MTHAPVLPPGQVWGAWSWDPAVVLGLTALVVLYVRAVRTLWSAGRRPIGISRGRVAAFGAAVITLLAALVSPLDALGGQLFAAHMVQHLLLVLVAAPLLLVGRAHLAVLPLVPVGLRRRAGRVLARAGRRLGAAVVALAVVVHVLIVVAWHVPPLYDLAVRRAPAHAAEHLTMLAAGVAFWAAMGAVRARPSAAAAAGAFGTSLATGLLSALLSFADGPLYDAHLASAFRWGLTPLEDQQVAAAIMWIGGGTVYLATAVGVVVRWLGEDQRRLTAQRPAPR